MNTTNNVFERTSYSDLITALETIASVDTLNNDKLAVQKGRLILTPGGFLQAPTRTVKNFFYGGYNRDAVLSKLEEIATSLELIAKDLIANPDFHCKDHKDDFLRFIKLVDKASTRINEINNSYGPIPFYPVLPSSAWTSFDDRMHECMTKISGETSLPLKKSPFPTLKPKKLDELLTEINQLEQKLIPKWKMTVGLIIKWASFFFIATPLFICAAPIKWLIANPIEYWLKGKVTTFDPGVWFQKALETHLPLHDASKEKIQKLSRDFFYFKPNLTSVQVDSIIKCLPYLDNIQLKYFRLGIPKTNITELWDAITDIDLKQDLFNIDEQNIIKYLITNHYNGELIPPEEFQLLLTECKDQEKLKWVINPETSSYSPPQAQTMNTLEERREYLLTQLKSDDSPAAPFFDKYSHTDDNHVASKIEKGDFNTLLSAAMKAINIKLIVIPDFAVGKVDGIMYSHGFQKRVYASSGEQNDCFDRRWTFLKMIKGEC